MQVVATKKLLRSISGIGGIGDRTLAKVLAWVKDNPEVLLGHRHMQRYAI